MFNRIEIKQTAKTILREARPHFAYVMLAYVLLTSILPDMLYLLTGSPGAKVSLYLAQGYTQEEVLGYLFSPEMLPRTMAGEAVSLVVSIFTGVIAFGLVSYTLRLSRREGGGISNLFDGFSKLGRVVWLNILTTLFTGLWTLLYTLPIWIVVLAVTLYSGPAGLISVLFGWLWILIMVTVAVSIVVSLRYQLAEYLVLDDPECTAYQALRRSKEAMRGHKSEFFTLMFSFFGWICLSFVVQMVCSGLGAEVLGTLLASILSLWITPYMLVCYAQFYDYVMADRQRSLGAPGPLGGYAGPDYDYHASDRPEPF